MSHWDPGRTRPPPRTDRTARDDSRKRTGNSGIHTFMRTWVPFPSLALQPIAPPKVKRSHLQLAYPVALTMLKHHTVCDRTIEVRAEHRTATGQQGNYLLPDVGVRCESTRFMYAPHFCVRMYCNRSDKTCKYCLSCFYVRPSCRLETQR